MNIYLCKSVLNFTRKKGNTYNNELVNIYIYINYISGNTYKRMEVKERKID